ncbi:pyruvate, water dikinase regulatory protein [Dialister sp.]|uniref:pyruvate, water dikinase regulatory protein n=1 Tax=Dialister sp. TaxID=1955814 RepID=UPI002E8244C4|nr:pyruvate, water dikinase regulatory protein [Dialister sp.]MEE3453114.1 pyruvate, water dikinase regulatory protein [Dialister sp.]
MTKIPEVYVVSDSLGETAESVAKATISQFDEDIDIVRVPFIRHGEQVQKVLEEASAHHAVVCHTLVSPELRQTFEKIAREKNVRYVDILGPMMNMVGTISSTKPRMKPGIIHKLDEEYFKKVAAIEFAVKYDDGKNPAGFEKADVVLIGVSRTSKTPLSMYMAHKKFKVANLPLVPEVPLPEEIFHVPPYRIIGLIIDPYKLNTIRSERMKALGFSGTANYTDIARIEDELSYAKEVMRQLHCLVIDVSNKAIEETASRIMSIVQRNKEVYGDKY